MIKYFISFSYYRLHETHFGNTVVTLDRGITSEDIISIGEQISIKVKDKLKIDTDVKATILFYNQIL